MNLLQTLQPKVKKQPFAGLAPNPAQPVGGIGSLWKIKKRTQPVMQQPVIDPNKPNPNWKY